MNTTDPVIRGATQRAAVHISIETLTSKNDSPKRLVSPERIQPNGSTEGIIYQMHSREHTNETWRQGHGCCNSLSFKTRRYTNGLSDGIPNPVLKPTADTTTCAIQRTMSTVKVVVQRPQRANTRRIMTTCTGFSRGYSEVIWIDHVRSQTDKYVEAK